MSEYFNIEDDRDLDTVHRYRTKSEIIAEMDALEKRFENSIAPYWVITKLDKLTEELASH